MPRSNRVSTRIGVPALVRSLKVAQSEEEVRLRVTDGLGISQGLRVIGLTDGYWKNRLFEFKHSKNFWNGVRWNKPAFGAFAQALYYCRRILNLEFQDIEAVPHTIVISDKNGGFLVPTKQFEGLLQFDPDVFHHDDKVIATLKEYFGEEWLEVMKAEAFTWDAPPSSQDETLVRFLTERNALSGIQYYDFSDESQLQAFIDAVISADGSCPVISITRSNFVGIFERWFETFAPSNASRREWGDRFVIDLRKQFQLDIETGTLSHKGISWRVPVQLYDTFWALYKRPPENTVDYFISANKDLLYDLFDKNNNGDFYTPLNLASLAHGKLTQQLSKEKEKLVWWDPAAGGGNLFMRFGGNDPLILTTKFPSDCAVLSGNAALKGSLIIEMDFVSEQIERDKKSGSKWQAIEKVIGGADRVVFFLNPPFDDQAESRGAHESLADDFIETGDRDTVTVRSLRATHVRFLYRILCILRRLNKPALVAAFSKTGWIVGPDSHSFLITWMRHLSFLDGLIVSSRVFNGIKQEWPCLFSIWDFNPKRIGRTVHLPLVFDVFDKEYTLIGQKPLKAFQPTSQRLSEIALLTREQLGRRSDFVTVAPLKNEFEVADKVYDDKLPPSALGYLRMVANDVYNSQQRVQLYSSMCGPSNHNGVPILPVNFAQALSVYGIRKAVRRNWLNDKDEFYLPTELDDEHRDLLRMAAVFALVDGGYTSSMADLVYKRETFSFRNEFFIASRLELRNWSVRNLPEEESFASRWLSGIRRDLSEPESLAIKAAKVVIKKSFSRGVRANGDPRRQLDRVDAGMRQLINGLFDFDGAKITDELRNVYADYLSKKETLRVHIENEIYRLNVLTPFGPDPESEPQTVAL